MPWARADIQPVAYRPRGMAGIMRRVVVPMRKNADLAKHCGDLAFESTSEKGSNHNIPKACGTFFFFSEGLQRLLPLGNNESSGL